MNLVAIVEGQGEVEAFPVLARRVLQHWGRYGVKVPTPIRCHRDRFLRDRDNRGRLLSVAKLKAGAAGAVIVLLDSDDLCAKEEVERLRWEIRSTVNPLAVSLVFAVREFESWFIAAAASLAGTQGLRVDAPVETLPERVRGAKEWLRRSMMPGASYSPSVDQPAFAARFDWSAAQGRAPSLAKLVRELDRLTAAHAGEPD